MTASNFTQIISSLRQRRTLLLSLCFLAYVLRLFHLDAQSLWYDEGFSVWLSAQPLDQIVARTAADIHPPLYYFLLHFWLALAGQTEFALRFLSLVPGVLLVPVCFLLARRLFDDTTAWFTTFLAAISPAYIWYAQEARMYVLLILLTVFSSYFFWRWMEDTTGRQWLAFTLCNALAVYLHFYGFFIVAFQITYFIIWWMRQETRWGVLMAGLASAGLVGAAYAPWARYVFQRLDADQSYFEGTLPVSEVLRKTFVLFSAGHSMLEGDAIPLALLFVGVALFGWLAVSRMRSDQLKIQDENPFRKTLSAAGAARLFTLLYLAMPFVLLYLVSYARPKFHPRYLLIASPPFFMLLAAAIAVLVLSYARNLHRPRRRFVALIAASLMAIFVVATSLSALSNLYFDERFSKDDFRGVARTIQAARAADEPTILVSGHMFPVYSYYDPQAWLVKLPDEPTLDTRRLLGYNVANDLNAALRGASGVWLVLWQNDVVDPGGFVQTILDGQAKRLPLAQSFWGVQLAHYQIQPDTVFSDKPQIQKPLSVNFAKQIELLGYNLPTKPSPADKGVNITLYWRALADLEADYNVALRVRDADGHLLGELNARPGNYNYPTTRWKNGDVLFGSFTIPLAAGTPPGAYQLDVTLYTAAQLPGLDVLDVAGNPRGRFATLQPIPIERATVQPTLDKLNPQHLQRVAFGNALEMVGFDLDRERAEPGEGINVTVYWRATATPKEDYRLTFQAQRGAAPDELSGFDLPLPLAPGWPTSQWKQGDVVREHYTFYLPTDATVGDRALRLALVDRSGKPLGAAVGLGDIHVQPSTRTFKAPAPRNADLTHFGGFAQLVGYDVAQAITPRNGFQSVLTVSPGDKINLTLYWHSLQRASASYTVFVHLVAVNDGAILAQRDSLPLNGSRPTTTWVPGEYITDNYELTLPGTARARVYMFIVGFYDARTSERVPIGDSLAQTPAQANGARLDVMVTVH